MLEPYRRRVVVAEVDANTPVHQPVDIVLYDAFAQPESDSGEVAVLVNNPAARSVVVYTWNFHPELVTAARRHGARGYLSKALPAGSWSRRWKRCTPGRWWSVIRPAARAERRRFELAGPR